MQDFILVTDFKFFRLMKNILIPIIISASLISCAKKKNCATSGNNSSIAPVQENFGPFGKESFWKCIGGDSIFQDTLSLTYFYTEAATPCNVCHYHQNISFWNDYSYTFSVSECMTATDTLIFTDIDSHKKTIFKRQK